uniref:Uncharacterized protein n=1 Tax=Rhizophora mucronata TaxID=61149 RepID=A0A2P2JI54_RHIMU
MFPTFESAERKHAIECLSVIHIPREVMCFKTMIPGS